MDVATWDATWSKFWRAYANCDQHTRSLPWIIAQQRAYPLMVKKYGERPSSPDDALWLVLVAAIRAATVAGAVAQLSPQALAQIKSVLTANGSSPLAPTVEKLLKDVALEVVMNYDWKLGLTKVGKALLVVLAGALSAALASVASDPQVADIFKQIPLVGPIVGGLVIAGLTWIANYLKNK